MKRVSAVAVLATICFCPGAFSQTSSHWTCIDAAGETVATDAPCPEGTTLLPAGARMKATLASIQKKPDWRSQGIPAWLWPIVGALGLAWIWFLLPDDLFRKRVAADKPAPQRLAPLVVFTPPKPAVPQGRPAMVAAATAESGTPLSGWTLELINRLSLNRLETLVQRFWQTRNCEVTRAKGADGGIELLISRPPANGKLFALAQCGATRGDKVSLASVKALAAAGTQKSAGIVVMYGLAGFTDEALAFAKDQPIRLITGAGLLAEIGLLAPVQQQLLLERTLLESGPMVAQG